MGDATPSAASLRETIGQAKRLVSAIGADLAVVFDRAAERLYLVDETGHEIGVDRALLLFVRLLAKNGRRGEAGVPRHRDQPGETLTEGSELEVGRTPGSLAELTKTAAEDGVIFAGALSGGYVWPDFLLPTTRWRACASCSSCWRRSPAPPGARCASYPIDSVHRSCRSVGDEGARTRPPRRAAEGTRPSPGGRVKLFTDEAGCRCSPSRTSRQCISTRKGPRSRSRNGSKRACTRSWRTSSCRDRRSRREARISIG